MKSTFYKLFWFRVFSGLVLGCTLMLSSCQKGSENSFCTDSVLDGWYKLIGVCNPSGEELPLWLWLNRRPSGQTIVNNQVGVSFNPIALSPLSENGGTGSIDVVLNIAPNDTVVLDVSTSDVTEALSSISQLTFTPANWNIPQTVSILAQDDDLADGNRVISLQLSVNSGATLDSSGYADPVRMQQSYSVFFTVIDDDAAGLTFNPTSFGSPLDENGGSSSFDVSLNTEPDGDVVIDVVSNDLGEAILSVAQLTFTSANWSTPQSIVVTGVNDDLADGNQYFNISLSVNPASGDQTGYTTLPIQNLALTVQDDDTAGITVNPVATLSPLSENGGNTTFDVVLNTEPNADVIIDLLSNDLSEANLSVNQLTFTPANWSVPQSVSVAAVNDDIDDGNQNFFITLQVNALSGDSTGYTLLPGALLGVTVQDDDTAGLTIVPAATLATIAESVTTTTQFSVALNASPRSGETVVIRVASSDSSEALLSTAGAPIPATTVDLTFTDLDWTTPQTVTVTAQNDDIDDGNQLLNISLNVHNSSTDTTGYKVLPPRFLSLTVQDDDTVGITTTPVDNLGAIAETGTTTTTFSVLLNTSPVDGENVNVNVVSSNPGEALVSVAGAPAANVALTFDHLNWNTPQIVTVTAQNDDVDDGNQVLNISLSVDNSSTDSSGYKNLITKNLTLTVQDDDSLGVTVDTSALAAIFESGSASFNVRLNSSPRSGETVIITVASSDTSEALLSTGGAPVAAVDLTFTELDWTTPQMITVSGRDDEIIDGDQAFDITLVVSQFSLDTTGYKTLPIPAIPFTVKDDEPPCDAIGLGAATLTVSWDQSRNYDVNQVIGGGHKIYISTASGVTKSTPDVIDVPNSFALTSTQLSGLTRGCSYYVRIGAYSALNPQGGELSPEATITIPAP